MNKDIRMIRLRKTAFVFFIFTCQLSAQHFMTASQVDTIDTRGVFINPAMSSVIEPQILLGSKFFHTGFLTENGFALRHSYLNVSVRRLPRLHAGFSLNVAQLSTPMYARTDLSVGLSKEVFPRFYLGAHVQLIHSGFNQNKFDLIHENDPLLQDGAGKTLFTPGVGLFFKPGSSLRFAGSLNYLNQPDQAVGSASFPMPRVIDLEVSWAQHVYHVTMGGEIINASFYPALMCHLDYWDRIQFYSGYNYAGFEVGSWIHLHPRVIMHYGVNFPLSELSLNSYGSHQVNFAFRLREPKIPLRLFDIHVETDSLFVYEEWIHPLIDSLLSDSVKADEFYHSQPHFTKTVDRDGIKPVFSKKSFSKSYLSLLDSMTVQLEGQRLDSLRLIINDENAMNRAGGMRRYVMRNNTSGMPPIELYNSDDSTPGMDVDSLFTASLDTIGNDLRRVYVSVPYQKIQIASNDKMRIHYWRLEILNQLGNIVFAEEGEGKVPERIDWPWEDQKTGRLIKPDRYYVLFKWRDRNDQYYNTDRIPIVISKKSTHIHIDISRQLKNKLNTYDGVDIMVR